MLKGRKEMARGPELATGTQDGIVAWALGAPVGAALARRWIGIRMLAASWRWLWFKATSSAGDVGDGAGAGGWGVTLVTVRARAAFTRSGRQEATSAGTVAAQYLDPFTSD